MSLPRGHVCKMFCWYLIHNENLKTNSEIAEGSVFHLLKNGPIALDIFKMEASVARRPDFITWRAQKQKESIPGKSANTGESPPSQQGRCWRCRMSCQTASPKSLWLGSWMGWEGANQAQLSAHLCPTLRPSHRLKQRFQSTQWKSYCNGTSLWNSVNS